jgi:diguanylate cyclase (GGDEF)-like protein
MASPAHSETAALAGEPAAADFARELRRGVAWLRFDALVEQEYRRSHLLRVRYQVRFWQLFQVLIGIVGINAVLGTGVPAEQVRFLLACVALHLVSTSVLLSIAFSAAYVSSYLKAATILMPLEGAAMAAVVAGILAAGGSGSLVLTIYLFGLFFISGLLLRQALPAAVVTISAFAVAANAFGVSATLAAYTVSSLLVLLGLTGYVAWETQRAFRTAFLEHGMTRADASRDALTGLANRRHFDGRLDEMWRSAGLRGRPLTAMLIDVDHFKAFNDTYGHQAGDEVLRSVARALEREAGPNMVVARFGGEEMALLATGLAEGEAEALARRLVGAIEALGIPHAGAPDTGRVTVSVGGTCLVPLPGRSAAGALQLADQNLYAAKRLGRNRAVFHGDQYALMQTGSFRHDDARS